MWRIYCPLVTEGGICNLKVFILKKKTKKTFDRNELDTCFLLMQTQNIMEAHMKPPGGPHLACGPYLSQVRFRGFKRFILF